MRRDILSVLVTLIKREIRILTARPIYWFCMVLAPLFCFIFFTTLMSEGLPTNLPIGIVDEDNTATTRNIVRNLDAFQQTAVTQSFANVTDARKAIQRGEIYAFYYIPSGTTQQTLASKQPTVSFYTNNSYLVAGSLLYRDLRTMSELAGGAVGRATLYAKGATEDQAMAFLQPIVIETHALNNPWLNYSVYLCNTIFPGILMLMIFLVTVFSLGMELKSRTAKQWIAMSNDNLALALLGKFLPQTIIFFVMATFYNVYLYSFLHFPCNSGIWPMLLAALLMVIASQAFGIFLFGLFPSLRLALSCGSLWGVVSFSISGFTFPVMAMHPSLQALSNLFPLRHYFLIYVSQALNGYPMIYAWKQYVVLLLFAALPLLVYFRLRRSLLLFKYMP